MSKVFVGRFDVLYRNIINSWLSAVVVIFVVFAIGILLVDDYSVNADELWSMGDAGRFTTTINPLAVIENLAINSPAHVPGYFILLSIWANLTGWSPTILRIPSIYFGILSLTLIYRLGRDHISKEAGLYSLIMLASLTFYNIWYLIIRMYSFYVFAELFLLWVYFGTIFTAKTGEIRYYIWLVIASLIFINTQMFSVVIFLAIGAYHLLFVPKSRHWVFVTLSFIIAGVLFSPWISILIDGAELAVSDRRLSETLYALSWNELISITLHLGVNGSILFLGVMLLSLKDVIVRNRITIALWVLLIATIAFYILLNTITNGINLGRSRYLLLAFPLMILLIVKGLLVFQRWRTMIIIGLIFWVASGLLFHRRIGYSQYTRTFSSFPLHYVERQLGNIFESGDLLVGFNSGVNYDFVGAYGTIIDLYFADYDIDIDFQHVEQLRYWDQDELHVYLAKLFAGHTTIWLVYETVEADNYLEAYYQALQSDYVQCSIDESIPTIVIENYQQGSCTS